MVDPDILVADFGDAAANAGIGGWPCPIRHETLPAPHHKPDLPPSEAAVYVFATSAAYGRAALCGPGTVLKVGLVTAGNEQRFKHDHYRPVAPTLSTLAQSLLAHPILWLWLGIQDLDAATVPGWMLSNLDRIHFFLPGDRPAILAALEVYIRGRTGSVFEGASRGPKGRLAPPRQP